MRIEAIFKHLINISFEKLHEASDREEYIKVIERLKLWLLSIKDIANMSKLGKGKSDITSQSN